MDLSQLQDSGADDTVDVCRTHIVDDDILLQEWMAGKPLHIMNSEEGPRIVIVDDEESGIVQYQVLRTSNPCASKQDCGKILACDDVTYRAGYCLNPEMRTRFVGGHLGGVRE